MFSNVALRRQSSAAFNIGRRRVFSFASPQIRYKFNEWPRLETPRSQRNSVQQLLLKTAGVSGIAIGLSAFAKPTLHCDAQPSQPKSSAEALEPLPPPPVSIVSIYELGFGTVCGVCAGIFIKKGAKALGFLLGGVFVLLQYLSSTAVVRVDWGKMATRFENRFFKKEPDGTSRAPTVYSLWKCVVNFLVADFQQRASFVAGFALGLRVG